MSRDLKKKQRKIQKQKAKKKNAKKAHVRQSSLGKRGEFEMAARFPILHCCEFVDEMSPSKTNVLLSRRVGGGKVAFVMFLIDYYCLGVKNIAAQVVSEGNYIWSFHDMLNGKFTRYDLTGADARKLVEGAVEYARGLGLAPARDYRKVCPIFGDLDPNDSEKDFVFGNRGKPCFVNGPYDSPEKIQHILATLQENCGEGNYEVVMMLGGGPMDQWLDDLEYDPDEDEYDDSDW
jgi:hypothetical protein